MNIKFEDIDKEYFETGLAEDIKKKKDSFFNNVKEKFLKRILEKNKYTKDIKKVINDEEFSDEIVDETIDEKINLCCGMKKYYLVDFENVSSNGLLGANRLNNDDFLFIFFSNNALKLDMSVFGDKFSCNMAFIKTPIGSQSMDRHLISYIGFIVGQNKENSIKIYIISKDKGYEKVINHWNSLENVFIEEKENIIGIPQEKNTSKNVKSKKKKENIKIEFEIELRNKLEKINLSNDNIETIIKTALVYFGTNDIYSRVHNSIKIKNNNKERSKIYKEIKPILKKYNK